MIDSRESDIITITNLQSFYYLLTSCKKEIYDKVIHINIEYKRRKNMLRAQAIISEMNADLHLSLTVRYGNAS